MKYLILVSILFSTVFGYAGGNGNDGNSSDKKKISSNSKIGGDAN
jgi:hypothetical protein